MQVKLSKEGFSQSAKILHKLIQEQFGNQGRGGLAKTRELFAQSLKFDSVHQLEAFLAKPEGGFEQQSVVGAVNTVEPHQKQEESALALVSHAKTIKNTKSLPLEERLHFVSMISRVILVRGSLTDRAIPLLSLLVRLEEQSRGAFECNQQASFVERILWGSSLDKIMATFKILSQTHNLTSLKLKQDIAAYVGTLPGYQKGAIKQADMTVDQHAALLSAIKPVLDQIQSLEDKAERVLLPVNIMKELVETIGDGRGSMIMISPFFTNHWLNEERFGRIVMHIAYRRKRGPGRSEDLRVWDFMLAALATSIEENRRDGLLCLLDIVKIPDTFYNQILEDLEEFTAAYFKQNGSIQSNGQIQGE